MSDNRMGFLTKFLGKDKAEEVIGDTATLQAALDQAGIERKNFDTAGIAEVLAASIVKGVDGDMATLTAEGLSGIIQAELTRLEKAQKPDEDEEEDEEDEEKKAAASIDKAYRDQQATMVKDLGDQAVLTGEVIHAFKELVPMIVELKTEVEALKETVAQRPRQASKSDSTLITGLDDKAEKDLKASIEEGITGEFSNFLGLKVKKEAGV